MWNDPASEAINPGVNLPAHSTTVHRSDGGDTMLAFTNFLSDSNAQWKTQVGKSKEYVNHRLKLLDLPDMVLSMIGNGLSLSQAEELSWFDDSETQIQLAKKCVGKGLTVQELRELARSEKGNKKDLHDLRSPHVPDNIDLDLALSSDLFGPIQDGKVLESNILALRYAMSFLDNSIRRLENSTISKKTVSFMIHERYALHQILDHFIRAASEADREKLR